jgi:hypothetical protein
MGNFDLSCRHDFSLQSRSIGIQVFIIYHIETRGLYIKVFVDENNESNFYSSNLIQ